MSDTAKLTTRKSIRASRIRRDPPAAPRKIEPPSREREILFGVTGVTIFAIAIAILAVGVSAVTGHEDPQAPAPASAAAPAAAATPRG